MEKRGMVFWAGAVLTMILCTGHGPVAAAPKEEVKTAAATFGNEIPIPRLEFNHSTNWMLLLYDNLVGSTESSFRA